MDLSTSDKVLLASTLVLAATALVAPAVSDALKRWWLKPELRIHFRLARPACHRTDLHYALSPAQHFKDAVFIYRLEVANTGRSQAKRCEMVLEGLDIPDAAGNFQAWPRFTPVNLFWGSGYGDFVDINPHRKFYCDLLSVPGNEYQKMKLSLGGGDWVSPPDVPDFPLGVILNSKAAFFSQPNRLPAGKYRLHLALYSENADTRRTSLSLAWSGHWKEDEDSMFKECVVSA
jgi:hypothetical protein